MCCALVCVAIYPQDINVPSGFSLSINDLKT